MEELFRYVCRELERRNIAYMVSGSVAMGAYSVSWLTRDFDLVIELAESQLDTFAEIFTGNFYFHRPSVEEEIRRRGIFNVIDGLSGFKIDFILKKETPFQQAEFTRRQMGKIWDIDCWIISVEDLILAKLIWIQELYSERQAEDIRNLLIDNTALDYGYLKHWITTLPPEHIQSRLKKMTDTPLDIRRLQGRIIQQKTLEQRLQMVFELIEGGQRIVADRLRQQHPHWSPGELKAAVFERIYRDDFSAEEMARIKAALLTFHQKQQ